MQKLAVALILVGIAFTQAHAMEVFLADQYIKGSYRYCVYKYGEDEWVRKIQSHEYCDLSIEVN